MTKGIKKIIFLLIISFCFCAHAISPLQAQSPTPTSGPSEQDVLNQIHDLENKIDDLQGQEKTLSSQISAIDTQISVTTLKINVTKNQILKTQSSIKNATEKIEELEGSLDNLGNILLERIIATYKAGTTPPLEFFISSENLKDLIMKASYLRQVQEHDRQLMVQAQSTKVNFGLQKQTLQEKQAQLKELQGDLEKETQQLHEEEKKKKTLLAETQGSEENYQKLLSQARAQLAGFSSFVNNQGGASALSNQTVCNDWGCYYNQRDSQWGSTALNHTQYTIASDGCLVTSMAMVLTHYGHKTSPLDINSNSSNFASYYPAYLLYTISANGVTASRIGATIDSTLSSNNPVIVGVHAYGGTHFVVLVSGSGGNYKMYDPYIENGHDISFSDHYSVGSIFEVNRVVIR